MCNVEMFDGAQQVVVAAAQHQLQHRALLTREQLPQHLQAGGTHPLALCPLFAASRPTIKSKTIQKQI